MAGKQRITSVAEQVRIAQKANVEILPPAHVPLDDEDMPFFYNVIDEFAKADWSKHQLEMAAMLSRALCNLEKEQRELRFEGHVIQNFKGTNIENPRARVVMTLTNSILALRRSLALNARARVPSGKMTEFAATASKSKEIEEMSSNNYDEDELFPSYKIQAV